MMMRNGEKIHGLKILAHCGSGAYGEVYFCEDISGRRLALKTVSKHKLGDAWERELRGVTNYCKITENASNLLQIFHVEEDEETFFYTMEAADPAQKEPYRPDTLAEHLKKGPLPAKELFPTLFAIFRGIRTIHDAGFAHRDIKPDNILFIKGEPKLGDIGLLSSLSATFTQLAGTLDFLPPEERSSERPDSDRRSRQKNDLYAFGKVVYCSATGCRPQDFPAIPAELPLTPELKFFLRLAFQLCEKDPLVRLDSLEKLEKELARIRKKLLFGETFPDKCRYFVQNVLRRTGAGAMNVFLWARRHSFLLLVLLLLVAGSIPAYRKIREKTNFDPATVKIRHFHSPELKLSMTLPAQWTVLRQENFRQEIENRRMNQKNLAKEEFEKKVKFLEAQLGSGSCVLFMGFEKPQEFCLIQTFPSSVLQQYKGTSEEVLRYQFSELYKSEMGPLTEIYEIKKREIAGTLCICTDLSARPGKVRTLIYLFILENRTVQFMAFVQQKNYFRRREEFLGCLKTLKFHDEEKK